MASKEFNEVLELARGVLHSSMKQLEDGFQMKDLVPIFSENYTNALAAWEGANLIAEEFKTDLKGCISAAIVFSVDVSCDLLHIAESGEVTFKETEELMAAVSGITGSIIKRIHGITAVDILPIVFENFSSIVSGVEGADKIGAELKGSPRNFLKAVVLFAVNLAFSIKEAVEKK